MFKLCGDIKDTSSGHLFLSGSPLIYLLIHHMRSFATSRNTCFYFLVYHLCDNHELLYMKSGRRSYVSVPPGQGMRYLKITNSIMY